MVAYETFGSFESFCVAQLCKIIRIAYCTRENRTLHDNIAARAIIKINISRYIIDTSMTRVRHAQAIRHVAPSRIMELMSCIKLSILREE